MQTAFDLVWMSAERNPKQVALVDDLLDRKLSYSQLILEVDRIAAGLRNRGIKSGDRFATVLPGNFEHCLFLLALQRINAVPTLINFRLGDKDIQKLMELGKVKGAIILSNSDLARNVKSVLPDGGPLFVVGEPCSEFEDWSKCKADPSSEVFNTPKPEDEAFIFYTSGTTGLPKGVILTHSCSEPRVIWLCTQAGLRHGVHNRTLGFMPLSHVIGFFGVFLSTLALNGTYYIMTAFDPDAAVDMVKKHQITYMFAVPQLYYAMSISPNYSSKNMESVQLALYGGGQIDSKLLERMDREWSATIRHIYGTTETMCSLYNPEPVGQHTRLRPGFYSRVKVIDVGGDVTGEVSVGEEGELIVDARVDTIFKEYLEMPLATKEKITDGWYRTGDLCRLLEDGDVDLIGRTDDIIRSGGENIHPSEIEPIILSHPAVSDVSVLGIPSSRWGEAVAACVVANSISIKELHSFVSDTDLPRFKRPKIYCVIDKIPRNAANKVLRKDLEIQVDEIMAEGNENLFLNLDES